MKNNNIERMCVSCRQRKLKNNLIRLTNKDGQATIDQNKQNFGRAIYVCNDKKCVEILKKSRAISRFLKAIADDNFYDCLIK